MIVLMEFRASETDDDGDCYLSTSTGDKWSSPVNLTTT